ncbi:hypothetical protein EMIHUDRAFT_460488 [Emiliania huxleyi CCMP1516]|uniref:Methyltransferase domain-containing protein n=2 Tax=Emiliania huxleyi TaxID=2903 RepID=A0A0D3KPQ1_EMIH1|nr:hypothetical protein EMIHUDRAFT_460488 [Emiliania huxleyi CCMP1516]EOD37736.1 hypothetical protein EMIHUDRAFT_460488 [Emiliania huxleyi CCMP1516]|eukprot:XP_005790165.1 hypothetical protein EMIHUDRAFT_460488 [Emiliania huxleyi CCMP1516]
MAQQQAPPAAQAPIVVVVDEVQITSDAALVLAPGAQHVKDRTPCLSWTTVYDNAGAVTNYTLGQSDAKGAFLPRCRFSVDQQTGTLLDGNHVLNVLFNGAFWSRLLTALDAANLFATSMEKIGVLHQRLAGLAMANPGVWVFAQLERQHGRFARVKEILESGQVFAEAEQAVLRSDPDAVVQRGKAATRRGRSCSPSVQRAVDVACGHGLVGLLLAYRFPALSVVGVDRRQRPAYTAYFVEGEAAELVSGEPRVRVDGETFVLCVHGCNEVNVEAVEMARECGASWMVVPCCLKTELYVQLESMRLTDAMQYAFLCGSMAKAYGAERVATLDARVTPRVTAGLVE